MLSKLPTTTALDTDIVFVHWFLQQQAKLKPILSPLSYSDAWSCPSMVIENNADLKKPTVPVPSHNQLVSFSRNVCSRSFVCYQFCYIKPSDTTVCSSLVTVHQTISWITLELHLLHMFMISFNKYLAHSQHLLVIKFLGIYFKLMQITSL